ncbi:hypothetical protein FQN57_000528 [Myotisia sp. PD_48]|nr:hypothetical protein FQN57_000528 [Myotisia sp. PD_48]
MSALQFPSCSYLSMPFWTLLLYQPAVTQAASIWHISIWNAPAPAPEDGPPLSASATRDSSLLWREIVAIVAAYVVIVSIFLGCLLSLGRRLRRGAQQSNQTLEMELVKPSRPLEISPESEYANEDWPSPMSPVEYTTWPSPQKAKGRSFSLPFSNGSKSQLAPPSAISRAESVSTIDESVVQADRAKAKEEMERLYAAVLEHDAQKAASSQDLNRGMSPSPSKSSVQRISPIEGPPEFRHLRQRQQQPLSPLSPMPPASPISPRHLPTLTEFVPHHSHSMSYQEDPASEESPTNSRGDRFSRLSNLSFLSTRSKGPQSPKKLSRNSIRNLPISPPMGSPELHHRNYHESQPLSPRLYNPGPPPIAPHERAKANLTPIIRPDSTDTIKLRPTPLSLNTRTAGSSTSTLPFRVAYGNSPLSAPPTKTTMVERRETLLGPSGPRTGVPRMPYSPYMPFTPITPLTPSRIVTRQERKQKQKQNGIRVLMEEDLVKSEDDMWGT